MEIIRDLNQINISKPCAVTVGAFDGLHLGHFKILEKLFEVSRSSRLCSTMVTFFPHPKLILGSGQDDKVKIITALDEKIEILKQTDLSRLVVIPFDLEFSRTTYEEFVKKILVDRIGAQSIIVGYDHAFGKNREGNFGKLKEISRKYDFSAFQVAPFELEGKPVSSTLLRQMILKGSIGQANKMLNTKYQINGKVVHGDSRGKSMNFPTANINMLNPDKLLPCNGVYAVDVKFGNVTYKGMMNIGYRPTFGTDQERHIEVHLHRFERNIYGEKLTIYLKKRLRDEMKFNSREELIKQLEHDKQNSLKL